jgi:hypothetical protein
MTAPGVRGTETGTGGRSLRPRFTPPLDQLRKIETRYGLDLNTAGKDNVSVMKGAWY